MYLFGIVDPSLSPADKTHLVAGLPESVAGRRTRETRFAHGVVVTDGALVGSAEATQREDPIIALAGTAYTRNPDTREGAAQTFYERFRDRGTDAIEVLRGSFCLAVIDPLTAVRHLFTDRIGTRHLYYAPIANGLIFGTRVADLLRHPAVSRALDPQAIYDYLYFHTVPSPSTIYTAIRKLPAASHLRHGERHATIRRYWLPDFAASPTGSLEDLSRETLAVTERAVTRAATEHCAEVGAFLSGGIDSSTVAGMLARACPGEAHTFSIGFHEPGYDEMEYARIAGKHFGTRAHEYYVTPQDTVGKLSELAAAFDEPFGNSSVLPAYFCAEMARRDGRRRLLAGDGGDEIFAGNERYAKQRLFELYGRSPETLRSRFLEPLLLGNPRFASLPPLPKVRSYIEQAKVPLPDRMETYNFLHRISPAEIFEHEMLAGVDTEHPISLLREHYREPIGADTLSRMLYTDWQRTLHDNDLVKVNTACDLAGVEVVYPLLDDELVELSCRVPSPWKLRPLKLRWFYKHAVRDFLPREIIRKRKHGFGLPFGLWTQKNPALREMVYAAVKRLGARGVFQKAFLDRAVELHRTGYAPYYGELLWVMMMLELWLEAHPTE